MDTTEYIRQEPQMTLNKWQADREQSWLANGILSAPVSIAAGSVSHPGSCDTVSSCDRSYM